MDKFKMSIFEFAEKVLKMEKKKRVQILFISYALIMLL